jgi:hypothetical protein
MHRETKITLAVAVVVAAVILLAAKLFFLWAPDAAATSQGDLPERESDGDLEDVGLNAEVFTNGDEITISGSIEDPETDPLVKIEVIDPEGQIVAGDFPKLTADDTFTYTFEAGKGGDYILAKTPMTVGGNYRVTITYHGPGLGIDEVDLEFKYIVTPNN